MIETRNGDQSSFFGNYVYNQTVRKNHLLRKIAESVDFSFVQELCSDCYCSDNGRPSWSPVLMFKVVFLQFLYNLSDYAIEEELHDRLSFKMFVGLEVEESPPDHSSISRFRDRLGVERFKTIFNRIVDMAKSKGIVSDKLHIVDATAVQGKVDLHRIKEKYKDQDPDTYIDKHSPDPDARPGRKHKGKRFFGYKAHCLMDAESEIIVNADASRGNEHERTTIIPLSEKTTPPRVLTADKGYDTGENHDYLSQRHIRNGIMLRSNHTAMYIRHHVKRISRVAKRYRCVIEHKFAELKQRHGLRAARYWGLTKMRIQLYMASMCANIKRMVKLSYSNLPPPKIRLRCVAG